MASSLLFFSFSFFSFPSYFEKNKKSSVGKSYIHSSTHSFIHNPQLPLPLPSTPTPAATTLPQYPLRPHTALLPAVFAQMPAFDLLSSRIQDALVVRLLLGGSVEAAVDRRVEGTAEGFADALV